MASTFWGWGFEGHLGLPVEDLRDDVFNRPLRLGISRSPLVHPPPHLRHPLFGGSPRRTGPWQGGYPLARALAAGAGKIPVDGRRCPGALGDKWHTAS